MDMIKKTNLIYKVVNGEMRVLGVVDNTMLANGYTKAVNEYTGSDSPDYIIESVNVFEGSIPYDMIMELEKPKQLELKTYVEVCGKSDFTEVKIRDVGDYTIEPEDYLDSLDMYHVFFPIDENVTDITSMYGDLIKSFCEVVESYPEKENCSGEGTIGCGFTSSDNSAKIDDIGINDFMSILNATLSSVDTSNIVNTMGAFLKDIGVEVKYK